MKAVILAVALLFTGIQQSALAQAEAEALARKLSNPIASLISVPFQNNMDIGIGDLKGVHNTLNIQPVMPFSISDNMNLITRVVLPVVNQRNITGLGDTQTGLGDAVVSAFLSPVQSKVTFGVGPVFLIPTGTDDFLTGKKFGIGPTAVGLYQFNGYTVGGLINQIWSVAGDTDRADLSNLFVQPFLSYNWKSGAGLGISAELTQNWTTDKTTVWVTPTVGGITSLGTQKVQILVGPRFNVVAPDGLKAAWGVRSQIVLIFPK
jgi:hypothetical protein